jgi:hypothetical protein
VRDGGCWSSAGRRLRLRNQPPVVAAGAARVARRGRCVFRQLGTVASRGAACGSGCRSSTDCSRGAAGTAAGGGCRCSSSRLLRASRAAAALDSSCGCRVRQGLLFGEQLGVARCGSRGGLLKQPGLLAVGVACFNSSGQSLQRQCGTKYTAAAMIACSGREFSPRWWMQEQLESLAVGMQPGRLRDQIHCAGRGQQELGSAASKLRLRVQLWLLAAGTAPVARCRHCMQQQLGTVAAGAA